MAAVESGKLHVLFVPYFTPSHMIPLVDAARLFAAHGVKVTIITTPYNAALFQSSTDHDIGLGHQISVRTVPFPAAEVGLPEGVENFSAATSQELLFGVYQAISLLEKPVEKLILDISPHCIFSDMFHPWTVNVAEKLKIPRLLFYPSSFLSLCVQYNLAQYAPHANARSDSENFLIPGLPDMIEMKRSQLENYERPTTRFFGEIMRQVKESELRSYGMVHDTIYELEPAYADYYKKVRGKKYWSIGPLFQFADRENANAAEEHSCLNWLDAQEQNKVLYISFGSIISIPDKQLSEIALALEASKCQFIWVVRNKEKSGENEQESWLPNGFEERTVKNNKGLVIRSWVPQLKILGHPAIGGFMTHCGWNSILEAIIAGVPLITWPLFAEQFYNEKLVEVLQFGIKVGADYWSFGPIMRNSAVLGNQQIAEAIERLMGNSEECRKIRQRVKEGAAMAKIAVEKGGSSNENLLSLIEELRSFAE